MIPQLDVWAVAPMMPVALGVLVLPLFDVLLIRRGSLLGQPLTRGAPGNVSRRRSCSCSWPRRCS